MLESRIALIKDKIEKERSVETKVLAKELNVTEKTLRRDLAHMEKLGLLKRVHGGAVVSVREAEDAYQNTARTVSLHSKEIIARTAFEYLSKQGSLTGKIIFIDAGTTNYEFAKYLKNTMTTIITNDLLITSMLSTSNIYLHVTGGRIFNNVNKYLVGIDAEEMIKKHNAAYCFVGATSVGLGSGYMTQADEDVRVKQAIMQHSKTKICLVDHTKFNKTAFVKYANDDEMDIIITDEASDDLINSYAKIGVKIITPANINEI